MRCNSKQSVDGKVQGFEENHLSLEHLGRDAGENFAAGNSDLGIVDQSRRCWGSAGGRGRRRNWGLEIAEERERLEFFFFFFLNSCRIYFELFLREKRDNNRGGLVRVGPLKLGRSAHLEPHTPMSQPPRGSRVFPVRFVAITNLHWRPPAELHFHETTATHSSPSPWPPA